MKNQAYSYAADAVVVIHFLWILFLAGGFLIGRRARWVKWLHLSALGYSVLLQIFSWVCPLTYLEVWLRSRSGSGIYSESFIVHYLEKVIYLEAPPSLIFALTFVVIGISAAVYYRTTPMAHSDS